MIGYDPSVQAIRAERGLPYATGADDPDIRNPVAVDQPGTQPETRPAA